MLYSREDHRLICCPPALNLSEYTVPEGTERISDYAFYGCGSLNALTLPASLTEIGAEAFEGCANLSLTVPQGSYAEQYCQDNKLSYLYPDSLDWLKD